MKTISYKRHRFPPRVIQHGTVKSSFYTLNLRAPSRHEKPRVTNPLVRAISGLGLKPFRSEEHTSELQSLMRISYAVFCLKKKKHQLHKYHDTSIIDTTLH